ncbi:MAG TPA: RNA 2',3'-cyclic phosphodiesterase [Lacunisphaera sp.]|nr:RNA 2',3'-cyclic phosphodiesterase [Lacunisphaera sp.]
MARLFVALIPPATVRAELAALALPLDGVRWVPEDNLHLTLRFIGDADADKQARLEDALARVHVEPFILPVGGVGLFPTRGPAKVLWAGTANGHTRLYQLRKQVDEALLSVDMTLDVHSFHPHFTLGRLGHEYDPKPLAKFLDRQAAFEGPPFRVSEFHLMSSELTPGRPPAYRIARTFSLVK